MIRTAAHATEKNCTLLRWYCATAAAAVPSEVQAGVLGQQRYSTTELLPPVSVSEANSFARGRALWQAKQASSQRRTGEKKDSMGCRPHLRPPQRKTGILRLLRARPPPRQQTRRLQCAAAVCLRATRHAARCCAGR